jgi:hypothetical protein
MLEPRRLKTLWAFTACYRDSFTFTFFTLHIKYAVDKNNVTYLNLRPINCPVIWNSPVQEADCDSLKLPALYESRSFITLFTTLGPIWCRISPVHNHEPYVCEEYFNTVLSSTPRSLKWCLPFRYSEWNIVHMSDTCRACYVTQINVCGRTHTVTTFKKKASANPSTCPLVEIRYNNLFLAYNVHIAYVQEKLFLSDRFYAVNWIAFVKSFSSSLSTRKGTEKKPTENVLPIYNLKKKHFFLATKNIVINMNIITLHISHILTFTWHMVWGMYWVRSR